MKQLSDTLFPDKPTCATIGFFDGVHLGHQFLLNELITVSKNSGLESLVVSFRNHPQNFFRYESDLKLLNTTEEKTARFGKIGLDNALLLNFDAKTAKMDAESFLSFLHKNYKVEKLLIGYDHHFGSDLKKDAEEYITLGSKINMEVIPCKAFSNNDLIVSSSKIRLLLADGSIEKANSLLGYPYPLNGQVTAGNQIGRQIGFPTANMLINPDKLIPKNGVYEVEVAIEGKQYKGMLNIGTRPTLAGSDRRIEVHALHFNGDIYGKEITVALHKFIREERKFDSLEKLKKQIEEDKKEIEPVI